MPELIGQPPVRYDLGDVPAVHQHLFFAVETLLPGASRNTGWNSWESTLEARPAPSTDCISPSMRFTSLLPELMNLLRS